MGPAVKTETKEPARLSRDLLIEACIRIADEEGAEAVTLRRLGSELGVDPTAVYRHFRDKEELLAATANRVMTDAFQLAETTGDWRQDLRSLVMTMRASYLAHPRVAVLFLTAKGPMAGEADLTEAALGIIRGMGLSDIEAVAVFEAVESYTLAVSCWDGMGSDIPQEPWRASYAGLPPSEFPNLSSVAGLLYQDADARFEFGLDLLLDAIGRRVGD
jgi:TetR/AcrR family transcriptional regulator, tetracycline repressor protein